MSWFIDEPLTLLLGVYNAFMKSQGTLTEQPTTPTTPYDDLSDDEKITKARKQLLFLGAGLTAVIAAPAIYSFAQKRKVSGRRDAKYRERGVALENASAQATGVLMTSLAAPAISAAAAYILVQKLEDAAVISKGLGNAAQTLLTVAAAGPAIQGIGNLVGSAFKKA